MYHAVVYVFLVNVYMYIYVRALKYVLNKIYQFYEI